jgi:hypothetical protein
MVVAAAELARSPPPTTPSSSSSSDMQDEEGPVLFEFILVLQHGSRPTVELEVSARAPPCQPLPSPATAHTRRCPASVATSRGCDEPLTAPQPLPEPTSEPASCSHDASPGDDFDWIACRRRWICRFRPIHDGLTPPGCLLPLASSPVSLVGRS